MGAKSVKVLPAEVWDSIVEHYVVQHTGRHLPIAGWTQFRAMISARRMWFAKYRSYCLVRFTGHSRLVSTIIVPVDFKLTATCIRCTYRPAKIYRSYEIIDHDIVRTDRKRVEAIIRDNRAWITRLSHDECAIIQPPMVDGVPYLF